jgi:hypothetical protein
MSMSDLVAKAVRGASLASALGLSACAKSGPPGAVAGTASSPPVASATDGGGPPLEIDRSPNAINLGLPWNNPCDCAVFRPCPPPLPVPACPPETRAKTWDEIAPSAASLVDQIVTVRGRLSAGRPSVTLKGCSQDLRCRCCQHSGTALFFEGPPSLGVFDPFLGTGFSLIVGDPMVGDRVGCGGDESRMCCTITPGQTVTVTGRMEPGAPLGAPWALSRPSFCIEP